MKTLLVTTMILATSIAQAQILDASKALQPYLQQLRGIQPVFTTANPPVGPVRNASGKVRIIKSTFEKVGTRYESKMEEVCEVIGPVDVFDVRASGSGGVHITQPQITATCKSTVEGQPVDVRAVGIIFLGKYEVFKSEPEFEVKHMVASVYTTSSSSAAAQWTLGSVASRDLGLKTALIPVNPNQMVSCSADSAGNTTCEAALPEAFFAIIEMVD